jgi:hypothetical protein
MYLFIDFDSYLVKTSLLIVYFLIILYAFGKSKEAKIKKREKAFRQKIYTILGTETLPLYKDQNIVNWSKVYNLLKEVPPSPERDEVMEIVRERRDARKISKGNQK